MTITKKHKKAVLLSIKPKWCERIAHREKVFEIRKNKPKQIEVPFKCYIYCTLPPPDYFLGRGDYCNELLRLQNGEIAYTYGMTLVCDNEHRPYSEDNFLCRKVIGEFACDNIVFLGNTATDHWKYLAGDAHEYLKSLVTKDACLTEEELLAYGGQYAWHISDLHIYDKPKLLSDFGLTRPPQSWCYV